jgi:hypothetical protein
MTTATTAGLQRDITDADESGSPRLPGLIDGWVRDGLLSAHAAMKVFSTDVSDPGISAPAARVTRFRRMEVMGYLGAGIITIAGLLILVDESVGLGTRLLVGVLVMIAMRHTMRPAYRPTRSTPMTPPRHRRARRAIRRAGS